MINLIFMFLNQEVKNEVLSCTHLICNKLLYQIVHVINNSLYTYIENVIVH